VLLRGFSDASGPLRKTPLYDLHNELGADMTGFGGWDMPLYYKSLGIMKEHVHCRTHAGLFDVSHMIPLQIRGRDRVKFIERVTVADVQALAPGNGQLSSLPNEKGGLMDDLIVTNMDDHFYMVINAGHEPKDLPHMRKHLQGLDANITVLEGRGLLALQGTSAAKVLASLSDVDLGKFKFMSARNLKVGGVDCLVTRSGYTGEDGFEILCEGKQAVGLARKFLAHPEVKPIGLGARDSLRLEAGLCLYGNDLDDGKTPIEAGLTWTISPRRRAEGGFIGAGAILAQLKDPKLVKIKRCGFTNTGPPARSHDKIFNAEGKEVGEMTSGVFGPTVKMPVSMGYVSSSYAAKGTKLQVEVRGKKYPLTVVAMPFTPHNFFRG